MWSEVSQIRITSSYTSQASRRAAESRNSSDVCLCYKQRSCLSRLPLWFTSWEKPQANLRHSSSNLFSTLEYCWRLFSRFLHWSELRLSTALPPVSQPLLSPALQQVSSASASSATFQTSSKRRTVPSHSQPVAGREGKKTASG